MEGGIRSFDLTMPEEINRILTDSISDYFFTTSEYTNLNLRKQGVDSKNIFYVGNTMIDTLVKNIQNLKKPSLYDKLKLKGNSFFVLTIHRPSNVDQRKNSRIFS